MIARRIVLGIESSCDDTCAALVRASGAVLGEAKHSQLPVHLKYALERASVVLAFNGV